MERRKSMFALQRKQSKASFFEIYTVEPMPVEVTRKVLYEPSHPLGPKILFSRNKAEKIMKEVIEEMLEGEHYDEDKMGSVTKGIANEIRIKLKEVYYRSRFKFVVTVMIVEQKQQDLIISRKQLHSVDTDASAEITYRSPSFVAHAYTVAFYQE